MVEVWVNVDDSHVSRVGRYSSESKADDSGSVSDEGGSVIVTLKDFTVGDKVISIFGSVVEGIAVVVVL